MSIFDVSIVGAGISGLSAALVLEKFQLRTVVLEKSKKFSTQGAGIQLGPNGTHALYKMNLLQKVYEKSFQPEYLRVCDLKVKNPLCQIPLGKSTLKKYKFPYLTILRSDLHKILENEIVEKNNISLIRSCKIKSLEKNKQHITLFDDNGKNYKSHALIGCDGVWSNVKQMIFNKPYPKVSDSTAFRTKIKNFYIKKNYNLGGVIVWFSNNCHIVAYPVNKGNEINIVVVTKQTFDNNNFGWSHPCKLNDFSHLLGKISNFEISMILEQTSEWFRWPIYFNNPIKHINEMTNNSVILLGDAAHPMKPHLAQGACMALEDSFQLKCELKKNILKKRIDWKNIFKSLSRKRIQRIRRVQKKSIVNGHIFQLNGIFRLLRNLSIKFFGRYLLDQKWLFKNFS